ncbi:MAG: CPBP family intramembrane glutamic endopeptidase [Myxococcota bacterium]
MAVASLALESLLVVWLIVRSAGPGYRQLRVLAMHSEPEAQVTFYRRFITRWWVTAAVAAVLMWMGGQPLGLGPPRGYDAARLVAMFAIALGGSVGLAAVFSSIRRFFRWQLAGIGLAHALFPRSRTAAVWFVPAAVTAGVCEEFVFRGLVPAWAGDIAAAMGGATWAPLAASAAIFGAMHIYQGWRGVILTGLFGGLLYLVTVRTGSLLPAMAIHSLVDLRFGALFLVLGPLHPQAAPSV